MRRHLIVGDFTAVAYLPVSYTKSDATSIHKKWRALSLSTLLHCINYAMKSLEQCAKENLSWKTWHENETLLLSIIASYIADVPVSENLMSMKRWNCTTLPCSLCGRKRGQLERWFVAPKQHRNIFVFIFPNNSYLENVTKSQTRNSEEMPLLPDGLELNELSFMCIPSGVKEYAISRLEALKHLSLSVNWLLLECIWNMLGDDGLKTSVIIT